MNALMASPTNEVNSLLAAGAPPAGEQALHIRTTTGQQPRGMLPAQRAFSGEMLGLLGQEGVGGTSLLCMLEAEHTPEPWVDSA